MLQICEFSTTHQAQVAPHLICCQRVAVCPESTEQASVWHFCLEGKNTQSTFQLPISSLVQKQRMKKMLSMHDLYSIQYHLDPKINLDGLL